MFDQNNNDVPLWTTDEKKSFLSMCSSDNQCASTSLCLQNKCQFKSDVRMVFPHGSVVWFEKNKFETKVVPEFIVEPKEVIYIQPFYYFLGNNDILYLSLNDEWRPMCSNVYGVYVDSTSLYIVCFDGIYAVNGNKKYFVTGNSDMYTQMSTLDVFSDEKHIYWENLKFEGSNPIKFNDKLYYLHDKKWRYRKIDKSNENNSETDDKIIDVIYLETPDPLYVNKNGLWILASNVSQREINNAIIDLPFTSNILLLVTPRTFFVPAVIPSNMKFIKSNDDIIRFYRI